MHIGPSDYVAWLDDRKWAYVRLEGRAFGDVPLNLEYKLEVWDSPNSAGIIIDAIRAAKIAKDRGIGGALLSASSYLMKSPPEQRPTTSVAPSSRPSSRAPRSADRARPWFEVIADPRGRRSPRTEHVCREAPFRRKGASRNLGSPTGRWWVWLREIVGARPRATDPDTRRPP